MAEVLRTVKCPLPGLDGVSVTYNLMASAEQINQFTNELGALGPVAAAVDGWPEQYGTDPFGDQAPVAFRVWAVQQGFQQAVRAFAQDPLS